MVSCEDNICLRLRFSPDGRPHSKIRANKLLQTGEILHSQSLATALKHGQRRRPGRPEIFQNSNEQTIESGRNQTQSIICQPPASLRHTDRGYTSKIERTD
jgi:hypothetical protein